MRQETTTRTIYKFSELSEKAQEKALEKAYEWSCEYDWWDSVYEDAKTIGIEITEFNIDRGSMLKFNFVDMPTDTADLIIKNHGELCDTFKLASDFLKERDAIIDQAPKDEDGEFEDESELDDKLDELEKEFQHALSEEYLSILRKEFEYLTSKEALTENIEANEYEFYENGSIA